MKYAFVIGTAAFIVPGKAINYGSDGNWKPLLRINSIYEEKGDGAEISQLNVDIDIKDTDGTAITIVANKPATSSSYNITAVKDSIKVTRSDGTPVIHVHQLDWDAAMALEHNITAEFEVQQPAAVIRITGEFLVDAMHVRAENEKFFIDDNGYATAAMIGHNDLKFTPDGVVL